KLYYLGQGLELIRTTFFRQTMFAEFQLALHEEVEKGGSLSGERMTDIYCGLLKKYYGDAEGITKINPDYCIEWAFIPHFYYGFYVYQYATSMAGFLLYEVHWISQVIETLTVKLCSPGATGGGGAAATASIRMALANTGIGW